MEKLSVFCIPFAGGSKNSFSSLKKYKSNLVSIIPLELPGRGERYSEELLYDLNLIVEDLFNQILPYLNYPYALLGHSMGGIIVNLLVIKISNAKLNGPLFVINSGRIRESFFHKEQSWHTLPSKQLVEKLINLADYSSRILENPSVLNFFTPIIRADIKALESYFFQKMSIPCYLIVINGSSEIPDNVDLIKWKSEAANGFELIILEGNHFFFIGKEKEILTIIEDRYTHIISPYKGSSNPSSCHN